MILESIPEPPNDAQPRRLVCPHCHARLLYTAPGPETYQTLPDIRCGNSKCRVLLSDPTLPPPAKPAHPKGKARGSDERPCDRTYYDALGVAPDCSMKEIKAAYRVAALAHHPDKNRDDPLASERFRTIAVAYQVSLFPYLTVLKELSEVGFVGSGETEAVQCVWRAGVFGRCRRRSDAGLRHDFRR